MSEKYIITSFKENGEFIGYLSAFSASGSNQFAPQMTQAIPFDNIEDCIYSDGQTWEHGRGGGGKGYYKIEKVPDASFHFEQMKNKQRLTPMQELIEMLKESIKQYKDNAQQSAIFFAIIEEAKKQLPKEKFVIETSYHNGQLHAAQRVNYTGEEYYNEAFLNIKPKDVKAKFTLSGQQAKNNK